MKGQLTTFINLEHLPLTYREKLLELEDEFMTNKKPDKQLMLLVSFANNYLMPREIWSKLIELYFMNMRNGTTSFAKLESLRQHALYQFYNDTKDKLHTEYESFLTHPKELRKLLTTDPKLDKYRSMEMPFLRMKEEQLKYPHDNLEKIFKFYERYSYRTPSTSLIIKYRKMKGLYGEIKSVEKNVEKWFNKLLQTNDHQFVVHNVEYRLGGNLHDISLWKLYIEYLRNTDPKEMLQLYSKYCRFFVDDFEMKKEYELEVTKYGPVFVKWKNPFDFEHQKIPNYHKMVNRFSKKLNRPTAIPWHPESACPVLFKNDYYLQNFSFPNTILYYILQNSNYLTVQKLHTSCKYFFAKKSSPVCCNFEYHYSPKIDESQVNYVEQSIKVNMHVKNLNKINDLYIANSLKLYCENQGIQELIQRFKRCEPKHIKIKKQFLTEKEFEYLVGHGNVETLCLKNVEISDTHGKLIPLENIMENLPKIKELRIDHVRTTSETSTKLCRLSFVHKITLMKLFHINNLLDLDGFFNFIKTVIHTQSRFDFSCSDDAGDDFVYEFKRRVNIFEKRWKKKKPMIAVFSAFEHEMLSHI